MTNQTSKYLVACWWAQHKDTNEDIYMSFYKLLFMEARKNFNII